MSKAIYAAGDTELSFLATCFSTALKGEKPADLPVMQPTKLISSLISKQRRRSTSPFRDKLAALADEVIE
jgi:hypothetical protein